SLPVTLSWSTTFYRGTWFASPLSLVQYMVDGWNDAHGGTMTATLSTDTATATYDSVDTYAAIHITLPSVLGTYTAFTFAIADSAIARECGFNSTSQNYSASANLGNFDLTYGVRYSLIPTWPCQPYTRSVEPLSGYAARAHDGTTYSYAGNWRRLVDLGVTLDRRDNDYTEFSLWRALWAERWGAGRAVTFYMDEADLPTSWSEELTNTDVLVVSSTPDRLTGRRSIDWNDAHAEVRDPIPFALYLPSNSDYEVPAAIIRTAASVGEV
ncbi:MAG: hypothetical protein VW405_00675, partial [Rhodospirillaceae bacterium]